MKQFQVPQFITVEDKVIGGILTVKQFLFIAVGAGVAILAYIFFPRILFFPVAAVSAAFAFALGFLKINERPVTTILKNIIIYAARPRLYIWEQSAVKREKNVQKKEAAPGAAVKTIPKLSSSKLSDLAWSLDIKEKE